MDDPLIWVRAIHFGATMMVMGAVSFLAFIAEPAGRTVDNTRVAALVCSRLVPMAWIGLAVIMLRRPVLPAVPAVETIEQALGWIDHAPVPGAERDV